MERFGPLRRGDFVLRTTNLRSWIAADATHLHHDIFQDSKTGFARVKELSRCKALMFFPCASDQFQPGVFHHFRVFFGSPSGSDQIAARHEGIRAGIEDP